MRIFKEKLLWTILEIWIKAQNIDENDLKNIFEIVKNFENKYSRFIKWNYLYKLNKDKQAKIDEDFKAIINIAKFANQISKWHFDITVLPFLENIWYGISTEKLEENIWIENVYIEGEKIFLKNNVSIEIWWIWKWYLIDVIFENLKNKYKDFIINFWWDIRIFWEKKIFSLENPVKTSEIFWKVEIENLALASSWASKRKTKNWHHLIDAKTWESQNEILWVFVTHKLASLADTFATTLFVSPIEISLEILKKVDWLEAMIITKNWEIYKSKWFNFINISQS